MREFCMSGSVGDPGGRPPGATRLPFLDEHCATAPPGKVTLVAVSAEEPAGKPVVECEKQSVCLALHRGAQDDQIIQEQGPAGFRQARIPDLCQEALSQGALLTREDLAYRVFFVSPRTITRDLSLLRTAHPEVVIPLRSTVHDIGPVRTHRTKIVRLALEGKTMTEICQIMHHSPQAVSNYLSTFIRCVHLAQKKMQVGQMAFLSHLVKARKVGLDSLSPPGDNQWYVAVPGVRHP
jgi:hypothetical protein